jgi:hypothetical protein
VVLSRSRARAVEELRPHREGRREEQSHTSMDGRERVVADALNLGERVTLREREKRKSNEYCYSICVGEEKDRPSNVCEKTHDPCDIFSCS